MSNLATSDNKEKILQERIIGSVKGDPDGPSVILLAGMHGNEPAGVEAVRDLTKMLNSRKERPYGNVIGIRANLKALQYGVRYVDEDMNRIWFPSIIENIRETPEHELASSERIEIKRLIGLIDGIINSAKTTNSPVILVDLHTFSAEGWMFTITASEKEQTKLLSRLQIPMVFGIEETLKGTALSYYQKRGLTSFGLEGGQHTNELTVYNTKASLLLLLEAAGCIEKEHVPELDEYEDHLREHTIKLPEKAELVYQHIIEPGDEFEMRPGFKNFQPVKKGEWLASDQEGKIRAHCNGFLLMPLYQEQGDDGFFIIREHDS